MLIAIEQVLSMDEVRQFRAHFEQADWQDGIATAGSLGRRVKQNRQLEEGSELAVSLGNFLLRRLGNHPRFVAAALPSRIYPPRFNCYRDGGTYGAHVDGSLLAVPNSSVTVRSDLSATLFLSEPDEYDGGELEIEGPFGVQTVKLEAGDLVLYPSTSLHRVTPVTRGARFASFFWIQSMVRDEGERALLFDLDESIQALTAQVGADDPQVLRLAGIYHNLLRRWAIT